MGLQRVQDRLDGAGRDDGAGGVVDQNEVRGFGRQRFQPGADGILPLRAAGDNRQMRQTSQSRFQQSPVADRLQQNAVAGQGFRGVAQHGPAAQLDELFGQIAAETCTGAGRDQDRGDFLRFRAHRAADVTAG